MSSTQYKPPTYPVIQFILAYGKAAAIVIGAGAFLAGVAAAWLGLGVWFAVLGLIAGVIIGVLLLSYVEVLAVIADVLIPK